MAPLEKELQSKRAKVRFRQPLLQVRASSIMLEQVLANLLENAVKFVPLETAPQVEVWSEKRGAMVRVCVSDNGIGMKPEHLKKLFQPFTRLVNGTEYPGTGIGLAIVRKGSSEWEVEWAWTLSQGKGAVSGLSCQRPRRFQTSAWLELGALAQEPPGVLQH